MYIAYINGEHRDFISLCIKCLESKMPTCVFLESFGESKLLSEAIWASYYFIPHGVDGEEFSNQQLIRLIWDLSQMKNESIIINYKKEYVDNYPNLIKLIAWDYIPESPAIIYSLLKGKWQEIAQ